MTQTTAIAWDGLALDIPAGWEPGRLGLGYLLLEDSSGPRLTLRWQRLARPVQPERMLKRLARRKLLKADSRPQGAVAAVLGALPPGYAALPCAEASGRGADAVLFTLPEQGGAGLAVLAAPHAREGEKAAPWCAALASLRRTPPGRFELFDVAGQAPEGFSLKAFAVNLGHYHLHFRSGRESLDFHRFAPAQTILRGKSLDEWANAVFAQELGRRRRFVPAHLDGNPAALAQDAPGRGPGGALRSLAARVFDAARFLGAMAWRPDGSKILAVAWAHTGSLELPDFMETCRNHVVRTP